jgi:hypothetical protein
MRPIDKGTAPEDANGVQIQIKNYQQSRGHLITRLGSYCSYCERYLGGNIAVEHIQPKSKVPGLELAWGNFLLACKNCNSIKGDTPIQLSDYYWPDQDNTFRAFVQTPYQPVKVNMQLSQNEQEVAQRTIKLTGIDRTPSTDPLINSEMSDLRWRERLTAWGKAERTRGRLMTCNTEEMREQIVETATSTGFFSIWMTVFSQDQDMLKRFVEAFPGTSVSCFDGNYFPVMRRGGAI